MSQGSASDVGHPHATLSHGDALRRSANRNRRDHFVADGVDSTDRAGLDVRDPNAALANGDVYGTVAYLDGNDPLTGQRVETRDGSVLVVSRPDSALADGDVRRGRTDRNRAT